MAVACLADTAGPVRAGIGMGESRDMTGTWEYDDIGPATPSEPDLPPIVWPEPPPTRDNRPAVIVAVILGVMLLVAGAFVAGYLLPRSTDAAPSSPIIAAPSSSPTAKSTSASASPEPTRQGPEASDYPAEKVEDLNRVCDQNVYYPQSPKRAGKAPHPIVLLVDDDGNNNLGFGGRRQDTGYYYDEGLSASVERTWAAKDATKVQLVACLDRVSTGTKIRSCKYDDPKNETLTLYRTKWRLRVFEVATARKLLDKTMSGDDQDCPYVVMYGPDKKIYATMSERAKIGALRNLVYK
jgi:hypothetical protein